MEHLFVSDTGRTVDAALVALGSFWRAGGAIDWRALHGRGVRRRVPLPTTPRESAAPSFGWCA